MNKFLSLLFLLPAVAWSQGTIPFTPAVIFNGDTVRTLRSQIDINGAAFIRTGAADPTVISQYGPKGSLYMKTGAAGGILYIKQDDGDTTGWVQLAGGGSVSSVALSMPAIFSVTGSPVTTSGTLTAALANQTANLVFAGPNGGGAAPPSFRALAVNDIPSLPASQIGSGQGSLTTSTTGVTIGTGANSLLSSATVNIQTATGSQPGLISAADWTTFNAKQAAGSYITALTGDVTASGPGSSAATVTKIQNVAVSVTAPTNGQVFVYNNLSSQWEPQTPSAGGSGPLITTTSFASPATITAAGGVTATADQRQLVYVQSAGGAVSITANPQISAGTTVGQELVIFGASATDYIILADGSGISLNGPINLTDNSAITFVWNGTVWSELSRR